MDIEADGKLRHYIYEALHNQAKESTNNILWAMCNFVILTVFLGRSWQEKLWTLRLQIKTHSCSFPLLIVKYFELWYRVQNLRLESSFLIPLFILLRNMKHVFYLRRFRTSGTLRPVYWKTVCKHLLSYTAQHSKKCVSSSVLLRAPQCVMVYLSTSSSDATSCSWRGSYIKWTKPSTPPLYVWRNNTWTRRRSYELHMMEQLQEQYTGCGSNIINKIRGDADKSLARPTSPCRRTESI